jgi:hypothetical protein
MTNLPNIEDNLNPLPEIDVSDWTESFVKSKDIIMLTDGQVHRLYLYQKMIDKLWLSLDWKDKSTKVKVKTLKLLLVDESMKVVRKINDYQKDQAFKEAVLSSRSHSSLFE